MLVVKRERRLFVEIPKALEFTIRINEMHITLHTRILIAAAVLMLIPPPSFSQPEKEPPPRGEMRRMASEKLKLTDAQEKQIKEIRSKQMKQMIQLRADLQIKRLELKELLDADAPDRAAVEKKMRMIADIRVQQQMLHFDKKQAIDKVLMPEQRKIADEMREDFRHGMRQRLRGRECNHGCKQQMRPHDE